MADAALLAFDFELEEFFFQGFQKHGGRVRRAESSRPHALRELPRLRSLLRLRLRMLSCGLPVARAARLVACWREAT